MNLNSTQNSVGANVLKRYIGYETSMTEDFEHRSFFFPGHEMRMRNHAHLYERNIHKETIELVEAACEESIPESVTIKVRNHQAHSDFFAGLGQKMACKLHGKKCTLTLTKRKAKRMVLFVTYSIQGE